MIERKFVGDNVKEFQIGEFVKNLLGRVGLSGVKIKKTPLGEKIIIATSRPGLVVGRGGSNIAKVTEALKKKFELENPQIEIEEVKDIGSDANIIAEMIAGSLERFGSKRFKGVGHKAISNVISSGAYGVEILISGKIPSQRAKTWRFYQGYLKKCGDLSISGVKSAYSVARLKTGIVGIKVSIMPSDIKLPDKIEISKELQSVEEEVSQKESESVKEEIEANTDEKIDSKKGTTETKTNTKNKAKSSSKSASSKKQPAKGSAKDTSVSESDNQKESSKQASSAKEDDSASEKTSADAKPEEESASEK